MKHICRREMVGSRDSMWSIFNVLRKRIWKSQAWTSPSVGTELIIPLTIALLAFPVVANSQSPSGPSPRSGHVSWYDEITHTLLVVGGRLGDGSVSNEVWNWTDSGWKRLLQKDLLASNGAASSYHAGENSVFMYGGWDASGDARDQLILGDGRFWQFGEQQSPGERTALTLSFDPARNNLLLYGGSGPRGPSNDTWIWNGSWTRVDTRDNPGVRVNHASAYDPSQNKTVLFGGNNPDTGNWPTDTWEWDGSEWIRKATVGPPPRAFHTLTYDTARHKLVLFGGSGSDFAPLGDTWEFDGTNWVQIDATGPSPRRSHTAVFSRDHGGILLFGGYTSAGPSDELWLFDGMKWIELE